MLQHQIFAASHGWAGVRPATTGSDTRANRETLDGTRGHRIAFVPAKSRVVTSERIGSINVRPEASRLASVARISTPVRWATTISQGFAAFAKSVRRLVLEIADLSGHISIAATAAAGVIVGAAQPLMRRSWNAIPRSIQNAMPSAWREAMAHIGKFRSAVTGEPEGSIAETGVADRSASDRCGRLKLVSAGLRSAGIGFSSVAQQALTASTQPQFSMSVERKPSAFKAAAMALLGTPLLTAPALAGIARIQPGLEPAGVSQVVINSNPTIVINAGQADDIEDRVLQALSQHREAIYSQWLREVQKRQRTEF